MLARTDTRALTSAATGAAAIIAAGGAATILGAWFFEYVLKYTPCPLCLQQRWPYYLTIPLALLIIVAARRGAPRAALAVAFGLAALILLYGAGLGVYHAGAEWKFWPGPQDCGGGSFSGGSAGNLLQRMQTSRVVRCDEAAWRDPVLGLSLAGWNVLIALALAGAAVWGALRVIRRADYGSSSVSQ